MTQPDQSSSPLQILLTEDHSDTARVMRLILERSGFVVHIAGTVAEALDAAAGKTFDLSICDMTLPDGTGAELSDELDRRHQLKSICLSGTNPDIDAFDCTKFAAFLIKPVEIPALLETIRRVTGKPETRP